ncbi:MAG TPA: response regulator transcription factor [Micromonosporaceae bacterium]
MRAVLVCVRTPSAARDVAAAAGRMGLAAVVRATSSASEAMLHLAERPADIVLADTAVARPDPVEFTRRVLARAPDAVVIFVGAERPRLAAAVVAAGARGLLPYDGRDPVGVVAKAALLLGLQPAGPVVPVQRGDGSADGSGDAGGCASAQSETGVPRAVLLTERESQVLRGMADGKSNAEIGREIFVSEDTVKTHARRLFRKLGARDRAHAVAAGFRAGLVA